MSIVLLDYGVSKNYRTIQQSKLVKSILSFEKLKHNPSQNIGLITIGPGLNKCNIFYTNIRAQGRN